MAVKVRLRSQGSTNHRSFRLVVTDVRAPRDGKYIECVGTYNPYAEKDEDKITLKADRLQHWLDFGAQMSESVESLVKKNSPALVQMLNVKREKALAKRR